MAACTTTYFETGRSVVARVAERNGELMAQQARRRRGVRTPEFYFVRHIDNSRLVKAADPVRVREMRSFAYAVAVLFSLIMVYGLQHFYAIEKSYRVESEKQTIEQLREQNRQLHLSEAELEDPGRIDGLAHELGLAAPQPGQVVQPTVTDLSPGAPVLAQIVPPAAAAR